MKISGRIILQKPEPVPVDLTRKELAKWIFGYFRAIDDAAKLATEADALMAELSDAVRALKDYGNQGHKDHRAAWAMNKAQTALKHYQEYVK